MLTFTCAIPRRLVTVEFTVRISFKHLLPSYQNASILQDFNECLKKIDEQLRASNGQSEYPLYIKGNRFVS